MTRCIFLTHALLIGCYTSSTPATPIDAAAADVFVDTNVLDTNVLDTNGPDQGRDGPEPVCTPSVAYFIRPLEGNPTGCDLLTECALTILPSGLGNWMCGDDTGAEVLSRQCSLDISTCNCRDEAGTRLDFRAGVMGIRTSAGLECAFEMISLDDI